VEVWGREILNRKPDEDVVRRGGILD